MRHGNWEPFLRAELEAARRKAERAADAASDAELGLARRLTPDAPHEAITPDDLRADPSLRNAREIFRERHRLLMTLRDECAGIEVDLDLIAARDAH